MSLSSSVSASPFAEKKKDLSFLHVMVLQTHPLYWYAGVTQNYQRAADLYAQAAALDHPRVTAILMFRVSLVSLFLLSVRCLSYLRFNVSTVLSYRLIGNQKSGTSLRQGRLSLARSLSPAC